MWNFELFTLLSNAQPTMAAHPILSLLFFLTILLFSQANARLKPRSIGLAGQFLAAHNEARSVIGQTRLSWDARLARYAKLYGRQRRRDCTMVHSNGPYGENIFWGSGSSWTPSQVVASWVSERRWYQHRTNTCSKGKECGHYTQIVWNNTRRVGCAMVRCSGRRGGVFVVCNYDPAGNYLTPSLEPRIRLFRFHNQDIFG